jgi:IPT/TIG domain
MYKDSLPLLICLLTFTRLAAQPVISGFTPASARQSDTVTISGGNFTGSTEVSFGGVAAGGFRIVSNTEIKAAVGPGASGTVRVGSSLGLPFCSRWRPILPLHPMGPGMYRPRGSLLICQRPAIPLPCGGGIFMTAPHIR